MSRPSRFPETRPSLVGALQESRAEEGVWQEFFNLYAPSVYRVACRHGISRDDADDIVQQVMVSISSHIARFSPLEHRGRFRKWIRVITENKINDLLRRRQRSGGISSIDVASCPIELPDMQEAWDQEWYIQNLQQCLKIVRREIAPKRFEAFQLYALDGVSAEETANRLGMTKTHVYVTRSQVIRRMRELFDEILAAEREP